MEETAPNSLRLRDGWAAAALAVLAVAATWPVWRDVLQTALTDEESGHILLVPLVALWMFWIRRRRLADCRVRHRWAGPALMVLGWICLSYGYRSAAHTFSDGGAILVVVGAAVTVLGTDILKRFFPAFVVLVFLIPVWPVRRQQLAWPLQLATARATTAVCEMLGLNVVRHGNLLVSNGVDVAVAEACNGMRMVLTLALVSFAYAFVTPLRTWVRVVVLAATPLTAITANVIRLVPTVWIYGHASAASAERFHDITGWVMLVVAFLLPCGVVALLRWAMVPVMQPLAASQTSKPGLPLSPLAASQASGPGLPLPPLAASQASGPGLPLPPLAASQTSRPGLPLSPLAASQISGPGSPIRDDASGNGRVSPWWPWVLCLILLACIAAERLTFRPPADAGPYHARIRQLAAEFPLRIGSWIGRDVPIPYDAVDKLRPNVLISRRYENFVSGRQIGFLLVQCQDAALLAGHFPPTCYHNQGYLQIAGDQRDWTAGDLCITGMHYEFAAPQSSGPALAIANFLVMPDGRILRDIEAVNAAANDWRVRYYGAAEFQIIFDPQTPQDQRDDTVRTFASVCAPVIRAIEAGPRPTAMRSRRYLFW